MNKTTGKTKPVTDPAPLMSELELARLGGGEVAYIKILSSDDALRMFPMVEGSRAASTCFRCTLPTARRSRSPTRCRQRSDMHRKATLPSPRSTDARSLKPEHSITKALGSIRSEGFCFGGTVYGSG